MESPLNGVGGQKCPLFCGQKCPLFRWAILWTHCPKMIGMITTTRQLAHEVPSLNQCPHIPLGRLAIHAGHARERVIGRPRFAALVAKLEQKQECDAVGSVRDIGVSDDSLLQLDLGKHVKSISWPAVLI